jgi:hypothetical protein
MSIFSKPYPKDSDARRKLFIAFIFGNFIFLFLWIFQPFGISEWQIENKTLILAGFGAITFVVVLLNAFVIELVAKNWFVEKNWKVWKEIIWSIWNVLIIGTLNLLYANQCANFPLTFETFLFYQWMALIIGIIPVSLITLWNYSRLHKRNLEAALELTKVINTEPIVKSLKHQQLTLAGENEKENIELDPQQLIYMEAADNYIQVIWESDSGVRKKMLRNTLKNMEAQLINETYIFRCHRSYLVNLQKVISVSGNSQGYKLHLAGTDELVPVSRSLNEVIREKIEEIHSVKTNV